MSSEAGNSTGTGGSFARFAIYSNYLYTIDIANLNVFDISDLSKPALENTVEVGWNIETIFPYRDKLFIGAQDGMHIFDNATPSKPEHLSTFLHVRACDPVVVSGNYAYVTLRSGGNFCWGNTNQLDVIDISDLKKPSLIESHQMSNPHGLGIDKSTLFVCEASDGLKIFDATDPRNINSEEFIHFDVDAYDVIPYNNNLILIGQDGLHQYDYTDVNNIKLLSSIKTK